MAKFYGEIGYGETVESPASFGKWVDQITEVSYLGDEVRKSRQLQAGDKVNDDLSVNTLISIVADQYANQNIFAMRYIRWRGALWKVSDVDVQSPRLVLTLGGIYNGPTPTGTTGSTG